MIAFLRKRFYEDRIKPIFYAQIILIITGILIYLKASNSVEYFYSGILMIIAAAIFSLNGLEVYTKKKRGYMIWFILSVLWLGMATQFFSFNQDILIAGFISSSIFMQNGLPEADVKC